VGDEVEVAAGGDRGRRRKCPRRVHPLVSHRRLVVIPVGDLRSVDCQVTGPLGAGANDAPRLAGVDLHHVAIAAGEAVELVIEDVGVTVAPTVVELTAARGQQAALIHLDDLPGTLEEPFDAAIAARLVVLIVDGRDHKLVDIHRAAAIERKDLESDGMRIEIAEVRRPTGFGVRLHDLAERSPVREVVRVVLGKTARARRDAENQP
jgi:hypothetical protein